MAPVEEVFLLVLGLVVQFLSQSIYEHNKPLVVLDSQAAAVIYVCVRMRNVLYKIRSLTS